MVADALSRRAQVFTMVKTEITSFDALKELCEGREDFGKIWSQCSL